MHSRNFRPATTGRWMWVRALLAAAVIAAGGLAAPAMAQVDPATLGPVEITSPIVTRHTGTFGGAAVSYDAIVESFDTLDLEGRPATRLVATSYIARDAGADRPVIFVFNGGPIAATTPLHMGLVGPKRLAIPDDLEADPATFEVVDNLLSPLDAADVVIFDPASTGYSRVLPGVDPRSQFSTAEDSRQLAQLVQGWTARHGRKGSDIYLVGTSYGTLRAAEAAHQLQQTDTPVAGLMLLGQALNIVEYAQRRDNIVSYAVSLPTLAAIGWWHGKADRAGRDLEQFVREASDYGAGEYLAVLFLGDRAPVARREAVATRLQEFTGLPAATFLAADLKVSKPQYLRELLPGFVLDTNDGRRKTPVGSRPVSSGYGAAATAHFRDFLQVPASAGEYSTAFPTSGGLNAWDWAENKSPFGDWPWVGQVREIMVANPEMRVFVGNGYYDTLTTVGAMDLLVAQSGWPSDQVRSGYFDGGHGMYDLERSAQAVADEIRALVRREW